MIVCLLASPAHAATIYKCRQAGGVISYQDAACPGRQIGVLRTPTTAAQAKAKPPATPAPKAAPGAPASTPASTPRPTPTGRAPRPSFKCVRPNGSFYYTGDARPKRTLIDAPTGDQIVAPVPGAPAAPPGKVWAQDRCATATRADACQYYQEQIAQNDELKAKSAGDGNRLTREGQRLRAIYNHRCS